MIFIRLSKKKKVKRLLLKCNDLLALLSLSFMTINEEYLGFGLLVGQNNFKTSLWAVGNCDKHKHFLTFF